MSFDAIGIAAKDVKQTIAFYEMLGLSFKECGEEHFEATLPSGLRIMLDSYDLMKKVNPDWQEPVSPGITLCFLQENSTAVDEVFQRLVDSGANSVKEPWDAFWGQRYSSVLDPNGNQIDIFASL